ncbi:hypothetical protein AALP_AA8G303400 [Arabis alpina]|uniref:Uncharacterized protein n=1 Tax=Arabis alpina TaxID=50452 RepID=A0A087GAF9_ARAAL|nr:hypothetical protein AALP_AA8G303400 [Arabis alpina]
MAGNMCKVMLMITMIMMGCSLQACNGMNVDESHPMQNPKFDCFRNCSINCGKDNKPCYQDCLTKCGIPQWHSRPTPSPSPSSTTV